MAGCDSVHGDATLSGLRLSIKIKMRDPRVAKAQPWAALPQKSQATGILAGLMSDMLQLVVEIGNVQATILSLTSHIEC